MFRKVIATGLFILVFSSPEVISQWTWQNPLPTGATYRGCDFIDPMSGWIVGYCGCIMRTSDGGLSWEVQHSGVKADLYAVCFINENYGWAVGNYGTILHTKNGGETWSVQKSYGGSGYYISSIYFKDSLNGWADGVNGGGQYYCTTNGGIDWQTRYIPDVASTYKLSEFHFTDSLFFWVETAAHKLSHTEDGGNTWIQADAPINNYGEIFFINHDTGWVTMISKIYRTNDRGVTWVEQDHSNQGPYIYDLHFSDPLNGWAVGLDQLLRTNDGGETWVSTDTDVLFFDVEFTGAFNGWAVGGWFGELFHTTDGGASWSQERIGTDGFMTDIAFGDEDFGMAITYTLSSEHAVMHTTDGGNTWERKYLDPDSTWWYGISLLDYRNGWLCGMDGAIIHTADGGFTWEMQRNGHPEEWLAEIQFINLTDGFAAGRTLDGTQLVFLKTTDGGLHWNATYLPFNGYVMGLWFTDNDNGYIVARDSEINEAVIFITRTGGHFWEELVLPTKNNHYPTSVQFVSEEVGYISAEDCVLKTTNRGESWERNFFSNEVHLFSLWFTDSLNGWCVGRNGYDGVSYRTTDGGENWQEIMLESEPELYDVFFLDAGTGWACGPGGLILKWEQNMPVFVKEPKISEETNFYVHPNPANSAINIRFTQNISHHIRFSLFSLEGRLVYSCSYPGNNEKKTEISVSVKDVPGGLYLYEISSGQFSNAGKIAVVH
jgi:photosystem II stability/assembly factor-like uncharacterized protein